jgi:uncharacterized repeat protein (TIGR03803 family)
MKQTKSQIPEGRSQLTSTYLAFNILLAIATSLVLAAVPATSSAQAQTGNYRVLYSFGGTNGDGALPFAGLVQDAAGNFYGTTHGGGAYDYGTVFVLNRSGQEKVLHSFTGTGEDGYNPYAGLVQDAAGNFYGTTAFGGYHDWGTMFVVNPSGQEKVLHSFGGTGDGIYLYAGLVQDAAGNFYGTTYWGGAHNWGTVFTVNPSGQEKVLYSFTGTGEDGSSPNAGIVQDVAGNLYGTTYDGGAYGQGTVFVVNRSGQEKVLHSFNSNDGYGPYAGLVQDAAGNFYGTTYWGGAHNWGTVFIVNRRGQEKVLHSFGGTGDGIYPYAGLVQDAAGNFYGTTYQGGAYGYGTVFVVNRDGQEKVLYSFTGTNGDGSNPYAGLVRDAAGNFYGTTAYGGAYGYGTVFELTP